MTENATIPVTTDNAKNIANAVEAVGFSPNIRCFAHTVNLASQKGMGVNQMQLLGRVRKVVTFFHRSTTAAALKGAVCKFLTQLKHKNTIICLQIFKKHAKLTYLLI